MFCSSWKDPEHTDWEVNVDRVHSDEGHEYVAELQGKHRSGIHWGNNDRRGKPMENVLVEDCYLRFCPISGTNFGADMKSFVVRRNVVVDHYPLRGHTMGFGNSRGSLLLEENIVDHCGWYNQRDQEPKIGWAIPLSHNLYYSKCRNTALVRNMWLRSASIGNKFCADYPRSIGNLLLEDNLFVDGELGPGIRGNYPGPYRNVNVNLVNNILTDIGRLRPTNRSLAWYFPLADWDGGNIANNLLIRQHHPEITNAYGMDQRGQASLFAFGSVDRTLGRPLGRIVDSKSKRRAMDSTQPASPSGLPRCTQSCTSFNSAAENGSFTRLTQPGKRVALLIETPFHWCGSVRDTASCECHRPTPSNGPSRRRPAVAGRGDSDWVSIDK